jgi:predicted unusual protein kinase regulating ubiquinone biosynthesis (AarF/ABC1/UbiB family)
MSPSGEPKLIVLDCGIVYQSETKAEHDKLVDICISFMKHDGYQAGKLMVESAIAKQLAVREEELKKQGEDPTKIYERPEELTDEERRVLDRQERIMKEKVHNAEGFCQSIQQMVIDAEHEQYFEHIGEYLAKICDLARKHVVRLDPGYFKIAMSLKVAEGISLALDNDIQLIDKCIPIVVKAKALQKLGIMKFPEPDVQEEEKFISQLEKDKAR